MAAVSYTRLPAVCRRRRGRRAPLQLHDLDRDLDHQPVVLAQVEAGELHDPAQPLAQRVRVDVERLRGRADVAAAAQELLERLQERGRALAVVVGEAARRRRGGASRTPESSGMRRRYL